MVPGARGMNFQIRHARLAYPSVLEAGIDNQPHGGGDSAKCGAKFADTCRVIIQDISA